MPRLAQWELRSRFAERLSTMYGLEVPAYTTLLDVAHEVNRAVLERDPVGAERFGSISRVTAERHGAIRVGTPTELAQVARVFGALGMRPVGFYDLRDASSSAVPVVSTAFRPVEGEELARNPFRVFTSMLAVGDPRFFSPEVQARAAEYLSGRQLFDEQTLALAGRSIADGGLDEADAEEFLAGAVRAFEISREPVDGDWYRQLEAISAVAADIAGVPSTHINHLTPRVLDIDELYRLMTERGIQMIDEIQGPPRWAGPDVLLRQTSFRALAEPRKFREADGSVVDAVLRVRFGEVEARGIALSAAGRELYDEAMASIDLGFAAGEGTRQEVGERVWGDYFPATEFEMLERDLGYFTFRLAPDAPLPQGEDIVELVRQGVVIADPIVYEDFLPRSAAGIFQSNLSDAGSKDDTLEGTEYDIDSLSEAAGQPIADPLDLYAAQSAASRDAVLAELGVSR